MKRLIDSYLLDWKQSRYRKPLLLRGARQVGKTYAVRNLGQRYENFYEINFELMPQVVAIFATDLQPQRIIKELSILIDRPISQENSLLFFDEIQACPQAVIALRYFYELMPQLHVIAAGSLLDFTIQEVGIPVGRVESLYMYPVSFAEYLEAVGQELLLKEIMEKDDILPVSEFIHAALLKLLGEYIAIGGMPEAIKRWQETKDLFECGKVHATIINTYRQDFDKYAKKFQIKYVSLLFNNIPLHMGKKFKFSDIPGEYRKRELSPCLDLLNTAGIIDKAYHSAAQGIPLGAHMNPDDFKVIFLDIALAQTVLGLSTGDWIINPLEQFINKGEIIEAFVGQELLAYADPTKKIPLYYWHREARGSQAEIDYVLQQKEAVIPIEVKSGTGTTLKSMHMFLDSHPNSAYGVRFSTQNYSVHEKIHSYPLYAVSKFCKKGI